VGLPVTVRGTGRRVHFVSLGCPKNRVDTEAMLGILEGRGWRHTEDPNAADAVVVNTCGFLRSAANESIGELRRMAEGKRKRGYRLVAAGCLAQMMGRKLARVAPGIDSLVGVNGYKIIAKAVLGKTCYVPSKTCHYSGGYYLNRRLTTGPGWAYLRIADGCGNRCSYCLIPSIRGTYRSRSMGDIVREAESLAARGVRELNLVAQDTTNYGLDLYGRRSLGRLLRRLDRLGGIEWIRLLYTHPAHWDEGLIDDITACRRVVRYVDLPLQHVSDRILSSMGRRTDKRRIVSLVGKLRRALPGLVLRTTFMVGYPGETEADFAELKDFVREVGFDRMGAFAFSAEPGTRAAGFRRQVASRAKERRLAELMGAQRRISLARHRERIGQASMVLIEGTGGNGAPARPGRHFYGRSQGEAPEVDGKVYVSSGRHLAPGSMVEVAIDRAWTYDLGGRVSARDGAV